MNDLKSRLDSASELTKDLPEAIRSEAFRLAFEELSGGATPNAELRGRRRRSDRKLRSVPRATVASPRSRRREGPKGAVETLIESGYLDQPRGIDEIRQQLDHGIGLRFEAKAIATSVLRLLRERRVTRERGDDNNYRYRAARRE
jgi:hypothetical protein